MHEADLDFAGVGAGVVVVVCDRGAVSRVADLERQKCKIVFRDGPADAHLRSQRRAFTANRGPAGLVCRDAGLARLIEEHEALHERHAGGGGEMSEGLGIARGEKLRKSFFALRAGRGKKIAERGHGCAGRCFRQIG